jgi:hypothetical protein
MLIDGNYAGNSVFSVGISENNINYINRELETNLLLKIKLLNKNIYEIKITFDNQLLQNITSYGFYNEKLCILTFYIRFNYTFIKENIEYQNINNGTATINFDNLCKKCIGVGFTTSNQIDLENIVNDRFYTIISSSFNMKKI